MWVELTLAQKRVYRAILEGKRELLAGKGASRASLPRVARELSNSDAGSLIQPGRRDP